MRLEFRISKLETGISVAGHLAALVSLLLMDLADHWQFSLIAVLAVNFGLQLSRILMRRPGSIRGLRFGIEQVLLVTRDGQIPAQVNRVVYQNPFLMVVEFRHLEDGEPLRRVPFGRKVIT